jgi:hypothetical protein
MRLRTAVLAALLACLIGASVAAAATVLHGSTSQGATATMNVGSGGALHKLALAWHAHCGNGSTFVDATDLTDPHGVLDHTKFVGGYTVTRKGVKARINNTLIANQQSATRWSGSFTGKVTESRNGRKITTCPVSFTWHVHG